MTHDDLAKRIEEISAAANDETAIVKTVADAMASKREELIHQPLSFIWKELARSALTALRSFSGEGKSDLGSPADWEAKLEELYDWTGSAFLAGEKVENEEKHKVELYSFLCGLIGWLMVARDAATLTALKTAPDGWRSIDTAPKDGTPIYVRVQSLFRFQPYKPSSNEAKRGISGRWQEVNEYGGWDNCRPPVGDWSLPASPIPGEE